MLVIPYRVKIAVPMYSMLLGNTVESFGLSAEDLEGDFDPEDYDGVMQKVFSKDYYDHGEEVEDEKPQFSDLEGSYILCGHHFDPVL